MTCHLPHGPSAKQVAVPDAYWLDPAVREIMQTIVDNNVPWTRVDDAVRKWFYHPPRDPGIATVRRNAQLVGLNLVIKPWSLKSALLALDERLWAR